jgi:2-polyprenyl-3-methyl-5-hydroxy-6-metoxy-1,4-benzoquinol methylase
MTLEEISNSGYFDLEDMSMVYAAYQQHCAGDNTAWSKVCHTHMRLPAWYDHTLDSMSDEYKAQQYTLWKAITGVDRDYDPDSDEQTLGQDRLDAVRYPGWHYAAPTAGSIHNEGEHNIAAGMIMTNSGIRPGHRVLEYGAGFGKVSVLMARLGATVDTVDISDYYCDAVKQQAEFYNIPLTAFKGEFGWNPRGDQKYDLILFYECFHHCVEFKTVIPLLKQHLSPNGKIILAGEPIFSTVNAAVPFEWGFRLNVENLCIMRYRHWFELGFTESFIEKIFTQAGFAVTKMECPPTPLGNGYIFTKHCSNE